MANDKLRAALEQAGLTADDLAQIVEVDGRTIRRWLSGQVPYPRQRGKVARALDTTEHELWPKLAIAARPRTQAAQPTDRLTGHPSAGDLDAPDWKVLMRDATDRIELLGDTLDQTLGTPGVPELLAAKAANGCEIRILIADPGHHLDALTHTPGVEIRVLEEPAHHTIHRYDDQLLLTLQLADQNTERAPLLHLHRIAPGGIFDRFAEHYNQLWEDHSQPLDLDPAPAHDQHHDEAPKSDPSPSAGEQPAIGNREPSPPPPRRWPRRPP